MISNITPEQSRKLDSMLKDGSDTLEKIRSLREGLNESIKELSDELEVKPKDLRNAIKIAHKSNYGEFSEHHDNVEQILHASGRGAV